MLKRALSIVLTLGIILSVLAVPAFATTVEPIVFEAENYTAIGNVTISRASVTGVTGPMNHPFLEELKTLFLGFFDI